MQTRTLSQPYDYRCSMQPTHMALERKLRNLPMPPPSSGNAVGDVTRRRERSPVRGDAQGWPGPSRAGGGRLPAASAFWALSISSWCRQRSRTTSGVGCTSCPLTIGFPCADAAWSAADCARPLDAAGTNAATVAVNTARNLVCLIFFLLGWLPRLRAACAHPHANGFNPAKRQCILTHPTPFSSLNELVRWQA